MSVRPAKTQISLGIRPVWSESSLCAQWVAKDPRFLHADSEDSDQTGWMPRLIWVFAGRTLILLVLSCRGSGKNEAKDKIWAVQTLATFGPFVSSHRPQDLNLLITISTVTQVLRDKMQMHNLPENASRLVWMFLVRSRFFWRFADGRLTYCYENWTNAAIILQLSVLSKYFIHMVLSSRSQIAAEMHIERIS